MIEYRSVPSPKRKRVAVFAAYSSDGILPPQILPYLKGLKPHVTAIVVVFDNDLVNGEHEKLVVIADRVITGRHGEYDFGSYKRGVAWARDNGLLDAADDLILCNDSCFGPIGSFGPMFQTMEKRQLDFWGATDSHEFAYHLQSYFVVLSQKVFASATFRDFIGAVTQQKSVQDVILNYEVVLTETLQKAGFTVGALVENRLKTQIPGDPSYRNLTAFPLYTLERGLPLVKVKALSASHASMDGPNRVLAWLNDNAPDVYEAATSDWAIKRFEDASDIAFSLVMPTHNRARCISKAISSAMAQYHRNFELIIVDDGSTDNSETLIAREFAHDIASGRIKYVRLPENVGVSRARNIGVAHARHCWVGYLDSDNELRPYFLTVFANAIVEHRNRDAFYAKYIGIKTGNVVGALFDREALADRNYIDLGVFVHRRSLFNRFGGFDSDLRRLVDWDLILRYTRHRDPLFVPRILLNYTDEDEVDRISIHESFLKANIQVLSRHSTRPTVSTVIVTYNHQEFITEAIESALAQRGNYKHEILLADDGSTDGTARMVARYAEKYPDQIRDVSHGTNVGLSENYRHCFREAAGEFVAILEGDDYWTDTAKNFHLVEFLQNEPEAAMVFARIELLRTADDSRRTLKRQDGLGRLITAADFAASEHLNLIANFSSTMFRRRIMLEIPSMVFEPRFNEITLSFYLDRLGKIGFIDRIMSVYRLNSSGAWTGAGRAAQLKEAVAIRQSALRIARPVYRHAIERQIGEMKREQRTLDDAPKAAAE